MIPTSHEVFQGIITVDPGMTILFQQIAAIAGSGQPVLITGETGVGKELFARAVHKASRVKGEFVAVNVAGLDDNVFSDTLFGHVKGAFTGAERLRPGMIDKASGGTLFLDEIGDLPGSSQVKLLRLLQEGEYLPLGADEDKRSNARVVAATNRDLWSMQRQGSFRSDLNFRLRTHHIHIPPLRERKGDLPLLVNCFLEAAAATLKKVKPTPPKELKPLLEKYDFPGNVRELQSMVFDAVSRHGTKVLPLKTFHEHMARQVRDEFVRSMDPPALGPSGGPPIFFAGADRFPTIEEAVQMLVAEAVKQSRGNQSVAARLLGISRQALNKRLKKIEPEAMPPSQ